MNIEKIKNYNTTMLAVIVTAAVAFAVIGLFAFLFFLITEVFNFFPRNFSDYNPGNSVEQKNSEFQEENADKLHIIYQFPELIDTANQLYIIPVSQVNSDQFYQESARRNSLTLDESYGKFGGSDSYDYYEKTYVNMLIYDAKTGIRDILFKKKVLIKRYRSDNFSDDNLLLMEIASSDTDNDSQLTLSDQKSLFIYSLKNKQLRELKYKDLNLLYYKNIPKTKNYLVEFGINEPKRSENKKNIDLSILCIYVYDQDKLIEIYDEKMQHELKEIVETK